jgi:4-carboxymuconolactone decarboxylase
MFGPRIPPLPADQLEAEHADLLERIYRDATGASNAQSCSCATPCCSACGRRCPVGSSTGSLSPHRDRELLILRTTPNCHAHYEWAHHVAIGKQAGLTDVDDVLHGCLTEG